MAHELHLRNHDGDEVSAIRRLADLIEQATQLQERP
jgi:hypothetical protein